MLHQLAKCGEETKNREVISSVVIELICLSEQIDAVKSVLFCLCCHKGEKSYHHFYHHCFTLLKQVNLMLETPSDTV